MNGLPGRAKGVLADFNHHGPNLIIGAVVAVVVAVEVERHHLINKSSLIYFIALIVSVVIHEVTHGVVAYFFGDSTAKEAGRLTLNPLRHISIVGTILVPLVLILSGYPPLGWAKPVPVSVNRLRHPRNQSVLVALAGPAVNLVLALIAGTALHFVVKSAPSYTGLSDPELVLFYFGIVNVWLAVFNLLPIPPLDGSAIVERFIPSHMLADYYRIRQLSMFLVFFVVMFDQHLLNELFSHALTIWASVVGI